MNVRRNWIQEIKRGLGLSDNMVLAPSANSSFFAYLHRNMPLIFSDTLGDCVYQPSKISMVSTPNPCYVLWVYIPRVSESVGMIILQVAMKRISVQIDKQLVFQDSGPGPYTLDTPLRITRSKMIIWEHIYGPLFYLLINFHFFLIWFYFSKLPESWKTPNL